MCIPLATVAIIASAASAAVGAYSSIQQGRAAYQSGMFNAEVAKNNAQATEDQKQLVSDAASIDRRRRGEMAAAEKGDLTAKFAAMGVDPLFGTPADLTGDVQQAYSIDRDIIGRNEITNLKGLDKQQADYLDEAKMQTSQAKGALSAGYLGAAGDLLGGASSIASHWIQPNTGFTPGISTSSTMQSPSIFTFPRLQTARALQIGGGP